ncbi:Protein of unknown function [Carboxydocella sporoproducens DSM 16521]|uniref:Uncharacterized protein n=2 Tax=Carboxydocella TaxID=178898 RepID=A0A1T4RG68_9FIRM|nr:MULTISPECIES: DUF1694 domain-containing protein [Carboxydocella]AVX19554.1 Protein of unknown function (DUF1694) [Carboxydocella thermautotrophica]AVX29971.1 Protein of unknown function (DUF1694) [Carboxydocella thermautotrophica]SKA14992.1 Protein of unknown function [Carboxydocella sporoproducens DSM 16521]
MITEDKQAQQELVQLALNLGEFPDQVLVRLTDDEVKAKGIDPRVKAALQQPEAKRMLLRARLLEEGYKYWELAEQAGVEPVVVEDPGFHPDTGLVVVRD